MRALKRIRSSLMMIATIVVAAASIWAALEYSGSLHKSGSRNLGERYRFAPVSRTVLGGSLTASGTLESTKRTVIECELENIVIGVMGQRLSAGGASTLISVIPDGSVVEQGTILAQLDASSYEELLRQQRITVERSRADRHQTELDYEVSKLAIVEFEEGLKKETIKDHQRLIALAESELARCKDRLDWSLRMSEKGYVSQSQVASEQQNHSRAFFSLAEKTGARQLFERYTAPKTTRSLQGVMLSRQTALAYQDSRLRQNLERLEKLEKQVELCTIRAPHDGFVIYANDPRREVVIEAGMSVRQKQDLFYLPDLTKMEVVTLLHESVVDKVKKGMKATISLESDPNAQLTGSVASIAHIPIYQARSDVRYFESVVKIDKIARDGLKPGMTARVEVHLAPKKDVLTVPVEAVTSEEGHDFCYVAREDGLERRQIALGEATHDLLEIADGLEEGEQVVLNPQRDQVLLDTTDVPSLAPDTGPTRTADEDSTDTVAALH